MSESEKTATVEIPNSLQVRIIRQAISALLAISIFFKIFRNYERIYKAEIR